MVYEAAVPGLTEDELRALQGFSLRRRGRSPLPAPSTSQQAPKPTSSTHKASPFAAPSSRNGIIHDKPHENGHGREATKDGKLGDGAAGRESAPATRNGHRPTPRPHRLHDHDRGNGESMELANAPRFEPLQPSPEVKTRRAKELAAKSHPSAPTDPFAAPKGSTSGAQTAVAQPMPPHALPPSASAVANGRDRPSRDRGRERDRGDADRKGSGALPPPAPSVPSSDQPAKGSVSKAGPVPPHVPPQPPLATPPARASTRQQGRGAAPPTAAAVLDGLTAVAPPAASTSQQEGAAVTPLDPADVSLRRQEEGAAPGPSSAALAAAVTAGGNAAVAGGLSAAAAREAGEEPSYVGRFCRVLYKVEGESKWYDGICILQNQRSGYRIYFPEDEEQSWYRNTKSADFEWLPPSFRPPLPEGSPIGRWIYHMFVNDKGKQMFYHGQIRSLIRSHKKRRVTDPPPSSTLYRVYYPQDGDELTIDLADAKEVFVWMPEDFEYQCESEEEDEEEEDDGRAKTPAPHNDRKRPLSKPSSSPLPSTTPMFTPLIPGSVVKVPPQGEDLVGKKVEIFNVATGRFDSVSVLGFDGRYHMIRIEGSGDKTRIDFDTAAKWRVAGEKEEWGYGRLLMPPPPLPSTSAALKKKPQSAATPTAAAASTSPPPKVQLLDPPPNTCSRTLQLEELRPLIKGGGNKVDMLELDRLWSGHRSVRRDADPPPSHPQGEGPSGGAAGPSGGAGAGGAGGTPVTGSSRRAASAARNNLASRHMRMMLGGGPLDEAGPFRRVRFARSSVHAYGVLADEYIPEGEAILQYVGQLIRKPLADLRERGYQMAGMDSSYLFEINQQYVCDATMRGGLARYVNHACEPNCRTEIHPDGDRGRIYIKAKRNIYPGEELVYDYKFTEEAELDKKVPCFCGKPLCRKYMC